MSSRYWIAIIVLAIFLGIPDIYVIFLGFSMGILNLDVFIAFIGLIGKFIGSVYSVWFVNEMWKKYKRVNRIEMQNLLSIRVMCKNLKFIHFASARV